uniref:Acetylcholinesterase n=1 Tax=Strongyloides papillosus TaxID=174720 RepID=A0A0N5BB68_STREA
MFKLLLLFHCFLGVLGYPQFKYKTPDGWIVGKRNLKFTCVVEFLGIPFAQPPIGNLRFKPPQKLDKIIPSNPFIADKPANTCRIVPSDPFIADKPANTCIHAYDKNFYYGFKGYDFWHPKSLNQSEDCLQLNMWIPEKHNGDVLVSIFGNGYDSGSPSLNVLNGAALANDAGIIVVNLNYRLGVLGFGFLNGTKEMPGNMGLSDQQLGLKWVYDNIQYFGVNKKKITLFGSGTGASSVTAHIYAPASSKYFRRVIANSGTMLNTWSYQTKSMANKNVVTLANKVKCRGFYKPEDIIDCLRGKSARELMVAAKSIVNPEQSPLVQAFIPVESDDYFFDGNIREKLIKRDTKKEFDIMFGVTRDEASYLMPPFLKGDLYGCNFKKDKKLESKGNMCKMNKTHFYNVVKLIGYYHKYKQEDIDLLYKTYANKKVKESRDWTKKLLSDFIFKCDIATFGIDYLTYVKGNKYFYQLNQMPRVYHWPKWMGVVHGYELLYEYGYPRTYSQYYSKKARDKEKKLAIKMMKLIGKFVKEGKPSKSSKWKSFKAKDYLVAYIDDKYSDKKGPSFVKSALTEGCKVIRQIQKKYQKM